MNPKRRPFVAYTIPLFENTDGAHYCVYCDAYGLEMTIDDAFPIDTVLFTTPELVQVITKDTAVTSMGTVFAGATSPKDGDFAALADVPAKWVLIEEGNLSEQVAAAEQAGLNALVRISEPKQVAMLPRGDSDIVIAFRVGEYSQSTAKQIRDTLTASIGRECRVVASGDVNASNAMEYLVQPDIDGVLIDDGHFDSIVELLHQIATHS